MKNKKTKLEKALAARVKARDAYLKAWDAYVMVDTQ